MFETFKYAFEAVAPLVLLIFFGYFLKRIGFISEGFVKEGYRFSFRIALPCMLFCNVYTIESFTDIDFRTAIYGLVAVFLLFVVGSIAVLIFVPDKRQRGVIVQCFLRSNFAIIGIPLAQFLAGEDGARCVAVLAALTIPLFNILAVVALSIFVGGEESGEGGKNTIRWGKIFLNILKNPLIIAIALGFVALLIRALLPVNDLGKPILTLSGDLSFLYSVVQSLGKIASPFMLLMLGGQFTFSATRAMKKQIFLGVFGRNLFAPIGAIGLGYLLSQLGLLSLGAAEYASYIALFASPVAVSSAIMAKEMHNDDILAGQLVVFTSIVSVFTIFMFVFFFRTVGLI